MVNALVDRHLILVVMTSGLILGGVAYSAGGWAAVAFVAVFNAAATLALGWLRRADR